MKLNARLDIRKRHRHKLVSALFTFLFMFENALRNLVDTFGTMRRAFSILPGGDKLLNKWQVRSDG